MTMEALVHALAHYVALMLETIAMLVITIGSLRALFDVFRVSLVRHQSDVRKRAVWLDYARWLVAGLTFQLAADIVNTSFAATWDEVGRLAAVAAIRTFLSYFLDREVENTRRLEESGKRASAPGQ